MVPGLHLSASVAPIDAVLGDLAGEVPATLGVDIQSVVGAPGGERLRVDHRAYGLHPAGLDLALGALRQLQPLVVSGGEDVGIFHDRKNSTVILAVIPRDTDSADWPAAGMGWEVLHLDPHWSFNVSDDQAEN